MPISISAYIPSFNDEIATLSQVIKSIFNQTIKFKKVCLLDDGSEINYDILRSYPCLEIHKNSVNRGRGYIRNKAIADADTDFVLFCDSTNILPSNFTETALKSFFDTNVAAVSGTIQNSEFLNSFITNWRGRHLFKEDFNFGCTPHEATSLTTYGTVLRRSCVLNVGNFNSNLRHSEDKELGKRLINKGYKIIGDPKLTVFSIKKDSIFSVLERYWRWYGGEEEKMSFNDYIKSIKASLRPMMQKDIKKYDLGSALISFICPHYGYFRYLYRKVSGKLQRIN